MNHIVITRLVDLQEVINDSLNGSLPKSGINIQSTNIVDTQGINTFGEFRKSSIFSKKQSPTYFPNMWALTFDDNLVKNIRLDDLKKFLIELLHNRRLQLLQKDPTLTSKFYLWFDEQALQLRFNLLFDKESPLPFGCNLDIVYTVEPVIEEFLTSTYQAATQTQVVDFFDPSEDQDDDDSNNYVLKVYVELL